MRVGAGSKIPHDLSETTHTHERHTSKASSLAQQQSVRLSQCLCFIAAQRTFAAWRGILPQRATAKQSDRWLERLSAVVVTQERGRLLQASFSVWLENVVGQRHWRQVVDAERAHQELASTAHHLEVLLRRVSREEFLQRYLSAWRVLVLQTKHTTVERDLQGQQARLNGYSRAWAWRDAVLVEKLDRSRRQSRHVQDGLENVCRSRYEGLLRAGTQMARSRTHWTLQSFFGAWRQASLVCLRARAVECFHATARSANVISNFAFKQADRDKVFRILQSTLSGWRNAMLKARDVFSGRVLDLFTLRASQHRSPPVQRVVAEWRAGVLRCSRDRLKQGVSEYAARTRTIAWRMGKRLQRQHDRSLIQEVMQAWKSSKADFEPWMAAMVKTVDDLRKENDHLHSYLVEQPHRVVARICGDGARSEVPLQVRIDQQAVVSEAEWAFPPEARDSLHRATLTTITSGPY